MVGISYMAGSSAETISLLAVGCVLLLAGAINECFTSRSPIIPPRLFKVIFPVSLEKILYQYYVRRREQLR